MLVVKHRDAAATGLENLYDLLEKTVTRIKRLALLIFRIFAVFTDDEHSIHGQVGAAQGEGFCHRRINLHVVTARAVSAEIVFGKLIDIETGQLERGMIIAALPSIAFEEAIDE